MNNNRWNCFIETPMGERSNGIHFSYNCYWIIANNNIDCAILFQKLSKRMSMHTELVYRWQTKDVIFIYINKHGCFCCFLHSFEAHNERIWNWTVSFTLWKFTNFSSMWQFYANIDYIWHEYFNEYTANSQSFMNLISMPMEMFYFVCWFKIVE